MLKLGNIRDFKPAINVCVILLATLRTWCKSPDGDHIITPARVGSCPPIVSVEEKQSAQEIQLFFSLI